MSDSRAVIVFLRVEQGLADKSLVTAYDRILKAITKRDEVTERTLKYTDGIIEELKMKRKV